ncbi:glyceraldehyde-3-phosphate dehydrogenase, type I [Bacteriovorax sp. BSW11_IV]|uniref:type I glyceraldehyde-3-phosphate dehydrogenase n=1 Tax=Bacteriovorax sp. BSW11_IV TaxID=1353529 RepID=UPI00038A091D|nr:type I glyceraldehyde-3-phosphate dehydrogenase [Bacteriovorax sp. BSW11_IV]EQC45910.1 glyceraldehyde-3-phosphate dehydrogenase, type I [Bacteriovorax sp. BSW11_IV]
MTKIKVGINGMGRIGRTVLREIFNRNIQDIEVVAVNSPGLPEEYVHLLRYDSVFGKFNADVSIEDGHILDINGHKITFHKYRDPEEIPWATNKVDIVIDATGVFKDMAGLGKHMRGTVKKVIMCAPGKDLDGTFVMGINDADYDTTKHNIVSNASCTTNCLAPVAKVLNDTFGIESGFMTTVHSYTGDQRILDSSHKDLRRARAAAVSMIPTTTGAAKAVGLVIPELKGKLDGYAIRVPTPNVSLVDLNVTLKKSVTKEEVNAAFKAASEGAMKGILGYTTEPLVSVDFMGMRESSMIDAELTNVMGGTNVKVVAWYDNEAGFSNRVIDLCSFIGQRL